MSVTEYIIEEEQFSMNKDMQRLREEKLLENVVFENKSHCNRNKSIK